MASSSVKLLKIDRSASRCREGRDRIFVADEGRAVMSDLPPRPLNLLTIIGPARSGKSFLMDNLARRWDLFRVSSAVGPCTSGADVSRGVMEVADFIGGQAGYRESLPTTQSPMIAFVDVEGQGARHVSGDVALATPVVLASKVRESKLAEHVEFQGRHEMHQVSCEVAGFLEAPLCSVTHVETGKPPVQVDAKSGCYGYDI